MLGERHSFTLTTRHLRAAVLGDLGRHDEALAEIDAFGPIEANVLGERHPNTLGARSLRIGIEIAVRRNIDHAADLRAIIAVLGQATGARSRQSLFARYRLASLLVQQGHAAPRATRYPA